MSTDQDNVLLEDVTTRQTESTQIKISVPTIQDELLLKDKEIIELKAELDSLKKEISRLNECIPKLLGKKIMLSKSHALNKKFQDEKRIFFEPPKYKRRNTDTSINYSHESSSESNSPRKNSD